MVEMVELVNLLGHKEIRIYELSRDNIELQNQIKELNSLVKKLSEAKPAPVLPFPQDVVNHTEQPQVD